jgi:dipeptidyl aminopeptidase/acylaminoacyl peptidase
MIFLAPADGADPTPLVSGSEPAFSPDGRQIVFVRATGLFVTGSAPGSPVRQLTHHHGDSEPRWSSTGEIVFQRTHLFHRSGATLPGGIFPPQASDQLDIITPPSSRVRTVFTAEPPEQTELHPDWSPNGRAIAVALCGWPSPPFATTAPTFVYHESCAPDVWAPEGRRLAEPRKGALRGSGKSTCPNRIDATTEISWQPLVSGTMRVPTVKCEPRAGPPETEVSPGKAVAGERTCYTIHHKHKCFTT